MGEDYFGNKYYEIPKDPSRGKSKTSRWFKPPEKDNHEQEMTAEWASWLRGRRKDPPTDEELMKNLAIMQMKKKNAGLLDDKFKQPQDHAALKKDETGQRAAFPRYEDYELSPGADKKGKE